MQFYWEPAIEKHIFITHKRRAINSGGEANTEECWGTCFVIYDFFRVCVCMFVCVFFYDSTTSKVGMQSTANWLLLAKSLIRVCFILGLKHYKAVRFIWREVRWCKLLLNREMIYVSLSLKCLLTLDFEWMDCRKDTVGSQIDTWHRIRKLREKTEKSNDRLIIAPSGDLDRLNLGYEEKKRREWFSSY